MSRTDGPDEQNDLFASLRSGDPEGTSSVHEDPESS